MMECSFRTAYDVACGHLSAKHRDHLMEKAIVEFKVLLILDDEAQEKCCHCSSGK